MADLGTDFDCALDWGATFGTVSGRRAHVQAIVRQLQTPLGHWPFAPEMGFDLRSLVGSSFVQPGGLGLIASKIENQCLLDERTEDAEVTVTQDGARDLTVTVRLTDSAGPFDFVIAFSAWTVSLISEVR